ncbi:MAG: PD40 domain-containing protein [Bacteroidales bacterium]|nr:PD40 domain-containing protein [Bacteroidales bacterium]
MKKNHIKILFYFSLLLCLNMAAQDKNTVRPAFPEILAEFVYTRDFTISPAEDEFYFTILSPMEDMSVIACSRKINGNWTRPEIAPFSGNFRDLEPSFSPDGLKLLFASNRPVTEGSPEKDFDIWYVERDSPNGDWSKPKNMGAVVNSENDEFYPCLTLNNNLYFTLNISGSEGKDDIFICPYNKGYQAPQALGDSVNSEGYEFNAFVAPDESYLLFTAYNRSDGQGSGDLYISRRLADGTWGKAKNLGSGINSKQMDYCPFVDIHTGTLYFTSRRNNLRQSSFKTVDDVLKEFNSYENGISRIYKTELNF